MNEIATAAVDTLWAQMDGQRRCTCKDELQTANVKSAKTLSVGFDNSRDTTQSEHHSQHASEMTAPIARNESTCTDGSPP